MLETQSRYNIYKRKYIPYPHPFPCFPHFLHQDPKHLQQYQVQYSCYQERLFSKHAILYRCILLLNIDHLSLRQNSKPV